MYDFRPLDRQNLIYYSTYSTTFPPMKINIVDSLTKSYPSSGTTYWHTYLKYIKICWKHAEKNTAVKFPLATTNFIPIIVNLVQFHPPRPRPASLPLIIWFPLSFLIHSITLSPLHFLIAKLLYISLRLFVG